jgi:glycogen(starch) synthase
MKVLLYSKAFHPSIGGVQTIVLELARGLAEWGQAHPGATPIEVTVVTRTPGGTAEDESLPFRLIRLPRLRQLIRELCGTEVVHLAGPTMLPLILSLLLRKPVVVEHHGYQSVCPNGLLIYGPDHTVCPGHFMAGRYAKCVRCNSGSEGWAKSLRGVILTFVRRWICQQATSNIAVSHHVAERIGLPRTQTVYHGICDTGPAPPIGTHDASRPMQIGYVGRLVSEKGLPLLLEAANRLDGEGFSFHLTFVGDGAERSELERQTRRLGLEDRTTFRGGLSGASLEGAVRHLQVVVMPSVWEETAGLAAIEQMMRGGVVVAADIGGLGEVVGDAGLKFPAGDSGSLCSCLMQVLEKPALLSSLGQAARARAMKVFNRDSMIQGHVSLYREALRR